MKLLKFINIFQYKEESLSLTVESLWKFAKRKVSQRDDSFFAIEFPCANPNDLTTIPNRILLNLEKNINLHGEKQNEYTKKALPILVALRPLNTTVAMEIFKKVLQTISKDVEEFDSLCNSENWK